MVVSPDVSGHGVLGATLQGAREGNDEELDVGLPVRRLGAEDFHVGSEQKQVLSLTQFQSVGSLQSSIKVCFSPTRKGGKGY